MATSVASNDKRQVIFEPNLPKSRPPIIKLPKGRRMNETYVHGYDPRDSRRLHDQASTLVELLHSDTSYLAGALVLEAGSGVGAQTVTLRAAYDLECWAIAEEIRQNAAEIMNRLIYGGLMNA